MIWYRSFNKVLQNCIIARRCFGHTGQINPVKLNVDNPVQHLKIGKSINGFEVLNIQEVPELRLTAVQLKHAATKAEYLHLYRNDSNNVFSTNFRTTPMDSTGLPHILEHTVLCGSKLYPVRDPFFKMLNRSLATFMNAMTGPDYTMYPFSTQNFSDYQNLQKIYLDAVFNPNLNELDFMQEGWRLENTEIKNKSSPFIIKGVVYNEMKGVFSENNNIMATKLVNLILPDHTYGVISGGDPLKIPDLTWEDLKNFHKKHYHPSNTRFYSYGNFPIEPTLKYIDEQYLTNYKYESPEHTAVPPQKRWTSPKKLEISGRFDSMGGPIEKQNSITISTALADITNVYDNFVLQFISSLLLKGPSAPFYKTMIEPNISGGFTQTTGFDGQTRDSIFTVGLQNVKKSQFEEIEKIYETTLNEVVQNGFEPNHIESILHGYELFVKHEGSNFGLHLLFALIPSWNHNADLITCLKVNQLIERLKNDMSNNPKFLQEFVQKYFNDNPHRLILTMVPDNEYDKKQAKLEQQLIEEKTKKLTAEEKDKIFEKNLELQKQQSEQAKTHLLPTLKMNDINEDVERIPIRKSKIHQVPLQINEVNSNGIVYFKGLLKTIELSQEQLMLLPLFCFVITKLGTQKLNYKDFDNLMNRKTSGLTLNPFIGESLYQLHSYEPNILITSYCLEKNVDYLWDLWLQIFNLNELLDENRFKMLTQMYMTNLTQGLADSGHIYATQAAAGLISAPSYQKDLLSGLQHKTYMKRLIKTGNYKAMLDEILNIAKILFRRHNLRCALNISAEQETSVLKSFDLFIKGVPQSSEPVTNDHTYVEGKIWTPINAINCQHYVLNIPVYFCSKAILTAPYTTKDYAALRILSRLLTSKYLHSELREKNGAYGGGASLSGNGVMSFYSYRDPRHVHTLDTFDNALEWIKTNLDKVTEQDVLEAKLGIFQSVDAPIVPSEKGCAQFLKRLTPDMIQRHRAELINIDLKALKHYGMKYLENGESNLSSKVILGPANSEMKLNGRPNELWTVVDFE